MLLALTLFVMATQSYGQSEIEIIYKQDIKFFKGGVVDYYGLIEDKYLIREIDGLSSSLSLVNSRNNKVVSTSEKLHKIIDDKSSILEVYTKDDRIFGYALIEGENEADLAFIELRDRGLSLDNSYRLTHNGGYDLGSLFGKRNYTYEFNQEDNSILIAGLDVKRRKAILHGAYAKNGELKSEYDYEFSHKNESVNVMDIARSKQGRVAVLIGLQTKVSRKFGTYSDPMVLFFNESGALEYEMVIPSDGIHFRYNMGVEFSPSGDEIFIAGFSNKVGHEFISSHFIYKMDAFSGDLVASNFFEHSEEFLKQGLNEKQRGRFDVRGAKGILALGNAKILHRRRGHEVRDLVVLEDGSLRMLGEHEVLISVTDRNGNVTNYFHSLDAFVFGFTKDGESDFMTKIPRHYLSYNYFNRFNFLIDKGNVHLYYSDAESNTDPVAKFGVDQITGGNRIFQITVDSFGNPKKSALMPSKLGSEALITSDLRKVKGETYFLVMDKHYIKVCKLQ